MKNKKSNKPLPTVTAPGHPGVCRHPGLRNFLPIRVIDGSKLGDTVIDRLQAFSKSLEESEAVIDVSLSQGQISILRTALEDYLVAVKHHTLHRPPNVIVSRDRIDEIRNMITQFGVLMGEGRIKSVSFKACETGRFCDDGTCGAKHCPACALKKLKKHKARSRKVRRDWLDDKAAMKGSKRKKAKKS